MKKAGYRLTLLTAFMLLLAGCSALLETGGMRGKSEGLTASSYAAADMLIQQSRSFVTPDTPLEIGVMTDLDNPNERTSFGRMVAEQIASRFVQLGYNVTAEPDLMARPPGDMTGTPGTSYVPPGNEAVGRSLITGRYAVARDAVLVNLRIVEASTGKVIAAYDYPVPLTRDVRELTKTQADKESFFNF